MAAGWVPYFAWYICHDGLIPIAEIQNLAVTGACRLAETGAAGRED